MNESASGPVPDDLGAPPPAAKPRDQVTDHNYDGIQEYDNPTPGWWVWIFAASVVFAFFYFLYYHGQAPNRTMFDRYHAAQDAAARKKLESLGIKELVVNEPNMVQWMATPDYVSYGRSVFKQNCTSCHGENGQGIIGPNLTDDYYKNIKVLTDFPRVISGGVAGTQMPAWKTSLSAIDIDLVATYVATLRGENLPSGISPATYGDKIPPWPPLPAPQKSATATAPEKN